ncbi:SDR family oxidoreductase [Pyxidicoccus fallax]|uniref:SDR family oxidoreductase n=1 Tax=Pyxidicoccus fallax TaxID=394095 RepID=A0A848LB74_9BACT|nr:SDR family oxidoreductase [Pyxidicoccus fallax]NMO15482.1 SDR family oxidoreductase [Pyxidicoccus fallax]NPC80324.1 SDR family oxidoreductase [Pyxidicoccus fallax]
MAEQELKGKTFLVTGANSGIGRATAEALASRGAAVVMASRSAERTLPVIEDIRREHPGADLEFLPLDLASLHAVKESAERFLATGRPLDVLINNAGIAATPGVTRDGFEVTFGTNHLGPFLFTSLLLPRLQEAKRARIVNVASRAHARVSGIDWNMLERPTRSVPERLRMYGVSKLMNVLHAAELARRLAGTGVTTYALHPGVVASEIWREAPWPIRPVMKLFMLSNEQGARTSLYCATAPELETVSGRYYDASRERTPSPSAQDATLARELYERSEAMVKRVLG